MNTSKKNIEKIVHILKNGGIGVMPTDTIYGLVGSALMSKTVRRIYKIRKRDSKKPPIILIGSLADLGLLSTTLSPGIKRYLKRVWPGKVSIILPCAGNKYPYLDRGTKTMAVRLPKKKSLRNLLQKTGPLIAPSANLKGLPHALNISEAKKYFGKSVDFYVDGGEIVSKPSTLISVINDKIIVLRGTLSKKQSKLY